MYPKLSVILPYYNAEKTLERAVCSVLNQTFKDFELILINNNSSDSGEHIALRLAGKDKRIKLISEKNQGVSYAANAGIKFAKSPYLARTDADDEMLPTRLEKQIQFLEQNPDIDICATQVEHVGDENTEGIRQYVEFTNRILSPEAVLANRFRDLPVINPTLMFRKIVFEQNGLFLHDNLPEDYEFFLRLCRAGVKFQKIPEKLHKWYDSETRLTRTHLRYTRDAFWAVKAKYLALFLKDSHKQNRDLYIWGAGRKAKRAAEFLSAQQIEIKAYIDVDKRKIKAEDVIFYTEIPPAGTCFIISFVAKRGIGEQIKQYLIRKNYHETEDFIISA